MMNSSLENALKETWAMKDRFYESTRGLTTIEILERIEGKKFIVKKEAQTARPLGKLAIK